MEMFDLEKYVLEAAKKFLYWLGGLINSTIDYFLEFFPDGENLPHLPTVSSFADEHNILSTLVTTLSWLLPLQFVMLCITSLSAFLFVYFICAPILRFFKIVK